MNPTAELRQAIREALDEHEGNRDAQVGAVGDILGDAIERACRPDDRWRPEKHRERTRSA